jgi:hypothetical protein
LLLATTLFPLAARADKKVKLRPYHAPQLNPEPELAPADTSAVEVDPQNGEMDALVLARPGASPMVGAVARGARVPVRGQAIAKSNYGCPHKLWYALEPFGYLCARDARPTRDPTTADSVLQVAPGQVVPFHYVMVGVKEGTFLPMWKDLDELKQGTEPERQLKRGDTIAVGPKIEHVGETAYYVAVDDKVVPVDGTFSMTSFSPWRGVALDEHATLPFGWVTPEKAPVYDAPEHGKKIGERARRERIDILEEHEGARKRRMLRIGDGQWIAADLVNEVRKIERPPGTGENPQWFDVDLGEQVVVAYENDKPAYATLIASGREPNHTPRGDYPIWGKVSAITMKSQSYDDIPYYVNKVPWVLFFQAHNALHGAYWHDRFGVTKSHGCANLSPLDARALFEWVRPALPSGWTGLRFYDLTKAPVAHVRNSHKRPELFQERNIGPPDKRDEAERVDQAVARREAAERALEAGGAVPGPAAAGPTPAAPTPPH